MYKQNLLDSIEREIILLKRLAPLIEEKDLDFKPTEKVRSTLELMQYLSSIGSAMMRLFVKNDLNPDEWVKIREYRKTLSIGNFEERLDEQWTAIKSYMAEITERDLLTKEVEVPWKEKMTLGMAIMNCPVKWLCAYRMELFLYLKMQGKTNLGTKEAWVLDAPISA